jgi:predicted DNA-binding transcriptional regulator YafY
LLDDDEAVAVAIGLRAAANGAIVGVESTAMAALAKLDQVLPTRLRHRVDALVSSTVAFPTGPRADVASDLLMLLAQACRGQERVRFTYRVRDGGEGERMVEPYRLVSTARQWYLVARDVRQDAWRTYRVDRITDAEATGHRFVLDSPPDPVAQVAEGMAVAPYAVQARVRLHASLADAERMVPASVGRLADEGDEHSTMLTIGGNDLAWLTMVLLSLRCEFEVVEPPELRSAVRKRAKQVARSNS